MVFRQTFALFRQFGTLAHFFYLAFLISSNRTRRVLSIGVEIVYDIGYKNAVKSSISPCGYGFLSVLLCADETRLKYTGYSRVLSGLTRNLLF